MKTKTIILSCILLLSAISAFCRSELPESERKINKTFQVSNNAQLQVSNKYGNITIVTWNKNEINFDVQIIGRANRPEDAKQMADRVDIRFTQTGNMILAETIFNEIRNIRSNNQGSEVHYTISLPSSVTMDLNNKYGNIQLENTPQPFTCDVKYGNLWANQLTGRKNQIVCKYGNVKIGTLSQGEITLGYGNLGLEKTNTLNLETSYSKVKIETVSTLNATSKYDNYDLGTVDEMKLTSGSYGNFYIMKLSKAFNASSIRYGKIRISEIATDFESIDINAGYTNINLGVSKQSSFTADLTTKYGEIDINRQFDISRLKYSDQKEDRYTRSAKGIIGTQTNPKAHITISNTYNNINISD